MSDDLTTDSARSALEGLMEDRSISEEDVAKATVRLRQSGAILDVATSARIESFARFLKAHEDSVTSFTHTLAFHREVATAAHAAGFLA